MKKILILSTLWMLAATSSSAQVAVVSGKIKLLYADPSDLVIELDVAGGCGSRYFHVRRTNENFREMTALAMTALAANMPMNLFVVGCATDRNIISHGAAVR